MTCNLEQRVLDKFNERSLIKTTSSGIKYTGASNFRAVLGEILAEIKKESSMSNTINPNIMKLSPDNIVLINPTLLDKANENYMSAYPKEDTIIPDMLFSGSTADKTLLDVKLQNPSVASYISNRDYLIRSFTRTRNNLMFKAYSGNTTVEEYTNIMKDIEKLNQEIDLLQEQITTASKNPTMAFVLTNAERDFKKIEDFLNGKEYINYTEIEELLGFYKRIGSYENNPILQKDEIYDKDGNILPEASRLIQHAFGPMKTRIEQLEARIEAKRKDIAMAVISNNSAYRELFADSHKTFDELLYLADGLPDTSLLDAYFMDITNGIVGSNGIIPQIMQMYLDSKMEEYSVHTRRLQLELSNVVPEVEKELKRLGKTWNMFLATTQSGLRQDGIISPINSTFYRALFQEEEAYREADINSRGSKTRSSVMKHARAKKRAWVQGNCVVLDINKIPEFHDNPTPEMKKYKELLISQHGNTIYDNAIKAQEKKLNEYKVKEAFYINSLLEENKAKREEDLPTAAKNKLQFFREEFSPFSDKSVYKYNELLPKTHVPDYNGNMVPTGYINESFFEIENNDTLYKFYEILSKNQELMLSMLPPDKQKSLGKLGLIRVEKMFWEVLSDPNLTLLEKISAFFKEFLHFIRTSTKKSIREHLTKIEVDPNTGRRKYKINDSWFKTNRDVIKDRYSEYELKIKRALGLKFSATLQEIMAEDIGSYPEVVGIFSELLGVPPIVSEIEKKLGKRFGETKLSSLLYDAITDQVVSEQSIDLPRMLMFQMHQVTAYAARTEAIPHVELLKNYYTSIKTAEGKERTNGIKQIESWFNRVVLDNYENNNELDALDNRFFSDKKDVKTTKAERERIKELEELQLLIDNEMATLNPDSREYIMLERKLNNIKAKKDSIGYVFSISNMGKRLLEGVRFKALGYNVNSNITNYAEGQISNFLAGEAGIYFNSEQLKRANFITLKNNANAASFGIFKGSKKVTKLMKKFNIQQDATNEFQKATKESSFDKLKKFGPFELTTRTEFLNQSPVMVAMLLNETITSKSGETSTVWDALDEDGNLKPPFDTEENISTWVLNETETYRRWKSKINKAIIDIHGDYHDTHGNMASEFFLGKVFLMFKRWMIRMIYARFGAEQIDLESGQLKAKGRYRSMTKGQLILTTSIIGAIFSPMFGVLGLGLGIGASFFLGQSTQMGIIQDLLTNIKALAWNIVRLPVNKAAFFSEKEIMKFANMDYAEMDMRDINNLKANISELTIFVLMTTILALLKGLLASAMEDDDEEDQWKKGFYTYLINKNMQLLGQSTLYLNPVNTYKNMFSEVGLIKHIEDIIKFTSDVNGALNGEEKDLWKNGSKVLFVPSPLRSDWLGLEAQAVKVYEKWGYDHMFEDSETKDKREAKILKKKYQESIEEMDISEAEKQQKLKELNKAFRKRTKESQEQRLERIESRKEEFDKRFTD